MPQETGPGPGTAKVSAEIWLDRPADNLAFGFDHMADGLTEIIRQNEASFTLGIFGEWGSGKTTLMNAIQERLSPLPGIICVEFSAWRFEREPSLLVPLLDNIRGGLAAWAERASDAGSAKERVTQAAERMGRIARALAAGLSAEVGLPGAVKVGYDLDKGMTALQASRAPSKPQSLYVAAFEELKRAIGELNEPPKPDAESTHHGPRRGSWRQRRRRPQSGAADPAGAAGQAGPATPAETGIRVVVFVDDLDRCLPDKALEVLESMKLFFDIDGFVFVAGVDEYILRNAVGSRLRHLTETRGAAGPGAGSQRPQASLAELEREYLDKIIQLPYRLSQPTTSELETLLTSYYQKASAETKKQQRAVTKYVEHLSASGYINPRKIKRFLNTFTLQMLTRDKPAKSGEPGSVEPLTPRIALALLVLRFRYEYLYEELIVDWRFFTDVLRDFRGDGSTGHVDKAAFADISPDLETLRVDLARYLGSKEAEVLLDEDLEPYLFSMDAAGAAGTRPRDLYNGLTELRYQVRQLLATPLLAHPDLDKLIEIATECLSGMNSYRIPRGSFDDPVPQLAAEIAGLQKIMPINARPEVTAAADFTVEVKQAAEKIYNKSEDIRRELRATRGLLISPSVLATPPPASDKPPPASDKEAPHKTYASRVLDAVEAALPPGWRLDRRERPLEFTFEGMIRSGAKNIVVETFYNRGFTGGEFSRAVTGALRSGTTSVDAVLTVAMSPNAPGFRRLEADCTALKLPHKIVDWQPDQPTDRISAAVTELTGGLKP
jgi:ABC-type dipeptide/oligopeptide/nickel transport system ATPase component